MSPCTKFQLIWRTSDFGAKFAQDYMNDKNFEKIRIKIEYNNLPLYQILVNLKKFRFCDQICPKNMNEKNFENIDIKTVISIYQCTPLRNFNQLEEIQIMGPNCPKNMSDKNFGKIKLIIVIST